jgi:drug/metabolite transporter (DMT)-like permease
VRGVRILVASVAVIAIAYLTDMWLADAFREGIQNFEASRPAAYGGVARLLLVALLVGLGWLVLRGPRGRLTGASMVIIGLYLALGPIYPAILVNTGVPLPPLTLEAFPVDLSGWASAAVAVLGVVMVVWPSDGHPAASPPPVTAERAPR